MNSKINSNSSLFSLYFKIKNKVIKDNNVKNKKINKIEVYFSYFKIIVIYNNYRLFRYQYRNYS